MRVAQLIDSLAPGGAEQSLVALAPELRQRGIDLEVAFLGRDDTLMSRLRELDVPVTALGAGTGGGRLANVTRTRRWLRDRRPDLLHTTLFEADQAGRIAATLTRTRVVSSLVNVSYGDEHLADPGVRRSRLRAAQALDTLTARKVTRFHAITDVVAQTMAPRLHIDPARIDVIHRGRSAVALGERSPSRRATTRHRLGLADDALIVLAAARHEHQKGLDVLMRATVAITREQPDVTVIVAGRTGNATNELRRLVDELQIASVVELLGPRDDVADLLSCADVFVLPSRWEGLGSVVIEAMALEAPIVASDLPAVREVVGDDRALLVPVDDPASLAAAVVATLRDPIATHHRAQRARTRFLDSFEIGPIADATVAFYERASAR